jgi:hypothetical protein
VSDVRNSGVEFSVSSGAATDSHLIPRSLCQRPGTRMGVDSPNLPILVFAGSRFERSAASRGAARGGSAGKTSAAGAAGIGGRGSFQRSPLVAGQPAAEAQGKLRRAGAARIRGGGSFQRVTARRICGPDRGQSEMAAATSGFADCVYATAASPFFSTRDSSLSEGPEGRFSPRSHLLTRLEVTFR